MHIFKSIRQILWYYSLPATAIVAILTGIATLVYGGVEGLMNYRGKKFTEKEKWIFIIPMCCLSTILYLQIF